MEAPNLLLRGFRETTPQQYLAALAAAGIALVLRGLLNQFVPDSHPYITVFIATAFSVWYAGLWPSMLTAAVGWLGAKYLFVPLLYSLRIATREERNSAIAYFLISFAIILFGDLSRRTITKQRRAQARLLTVQEELEERIRQRTVLLEVTNESLRDLSARLLKVRDEEQRRLARHLHDSTGQTLAVLAMNLHRLEGEAQKLSAGLAKTAAESVALAKEVSDSVRTVSYFLHPPLLDEAGLKSALAWCADGFEERSGIKVLLEMPSDFERQPSDLETAVFRIVQECLTNIHRHSASPTADIRICQFAGGLALEVQDTGKGIPAETLSKISSVGLPGIGLRGMRERVTALGGAFEILSEGKGTTVKAAIPLQAPRIVGEKVRAVKSLSPRCFASPPAALERNRQVIGHSSEFREPRRAICKKHPHEIYSVCSSRIDWPTGPHSSFSDAPGRAG